MLTGMSTTLREIAAAANTSVSTASRALNGHPAISAETVGKVREAAARLRYQARQSLRRPDPAQTLVKKNIAMMSLEMDRSLVALPVVSAAFHGAEAALSRAGAHVQLAHIPDLDSIPAGLDLQQLDGLILAGAMQGDLLARSSSRLVSLLRDLPTLWLLGRPTGAWGDAVMAHDYAAGAMAAEYLADRGHRQLAVVNPKPDHLLFMRREDGFLAAARRRGLDVDWFCHTPPGGWTRPLAAPTHVDAVQELVDQLLAAPRRPTAIFAVADSVAALVYRALAVREVRVGREISVISANNERPLIDALHPHLTTIDIHPDEIGRLAVEQLALRLTDPCPRPETELQVRPTLVEGESVAALPAA
jgi:LacI family transcriptional regulator